MIPTLYWENDTAMILDQRKLPGKSEFIPCRDMKRVIYCIQTLATRGAPAIGVACAMGLFLAARSIRVKDPDKFRARFSEKVEVMRAARPTAVNLSWACDRILALVDGAGGDADDLKALIRSESQRMLDQDIATNKLIGKHGATITRKKKVTLLTHCNAGSLATGGYGTALGVVYGLKEKGVEISVVADETRPLWQGIRLTAWEMVQEGIPVKVAVDGSSGLLMQKGLIDLCVVGADRIAANGDAANKIGTLNAALAAKYYGVPFYVAAPLSTVDLNTKRGDLIPIEERDPKEVLAPWGLKNLAPLGAGAYNFAFDVTPAELIQGIITEVGVLKPPYTESLAKAKAG